VEATDLATYAKIVLQCATSQIHDYYFSLHFILFTWHKRSPSAKCAWSHANNKFTKLSRSIGNRSNLHTQSDHRSNTNTTHLYKVPTHWI